MDLQQHCFDHAEASGRLGRYQPLEPEPAAFQQHPETITVVARLGYFDQSHLTRALRRYIGRTTTQLRDGTGGALGLSLDQLLTS